MGTTQVLGNDTLLDDLHVGADDQASVERGDGGLQAERLDEHGHATRRTPAGDGEEDARVVQVVHGRDGPVGEELVLGHQGAVDVGQQQADAGGGHGAYPVALVPVWSWTLAVSARIVECLASTRPAGIDGSRASSLVSAWCLSAPLTSHRSSSVLASAG